MTFLEYIQYKESNYRHVCKQLHMPAHGANHESHESVHSVKESKTVRPHEPQAHPNGGLETS